MHCVIDSPLGPLTLVASDSGEALTAIHFSAPGIADGPRHDDLPLFVEASRQLRAYFEAGAEHFELPLAPDGTPFQQRVWAELRRTRRGETLTYGELARRVGGGTVARAVGAANGANPLPIVIPCHRVIGAGGKLVGFSAGLERKQLLLALEGATLL